jgi:multisubunit Na+/H+ antiporter MnhE subunit
MAKVAPACVSGVTWILLSTSTSLILKVVGLEVSLASVFTFDKMLPPFDYFEHRRAWYVTKVE